MATLAEQAEELLQTLTDHRRQPVGRPRPEDRIAVLRVPAGTRMRATSTHWYGSICYTAVYLVWQGIAVGLLGAVQMARRPQPNDRNAATRNDRGVGQPAHGRFSRELPISPSEN